MASRADNIASNISFANFSKATELKQRIWFTIGALIVFRFLSFVPLPGVNPLILQDLYAHTRGGILDLFNTFSGGSLQRMSLIALGVMPYITASIVVQLAASLHPALAAIKRPCADSSRPTPRSRTKRQSPKAATLSRSRRGTGARNCRPAPSRCVRRCGRAGTAAAPGSRSAAAC